MVEAQKVVHVFARGINRHQHDDGLNPPDDVIERAKKYMAEHPQPTTSNVMLTLPEASMSNRLLNNRFKKIVNKEKHSMDTSVESLGLLQIIVFNVDSMLNRGMSLDGIIRLGKYLRSQSGARLDDIKIEKWLVSFILRVWLSSREISSLKCSDSNKTRFLSSTNPTKMLTALPSEP